MIKKMGKGLLVLVFSIAAGSAYGGGPIAGPIAGGMDAKDGDAKAGQQKSELCQGCHGVDGMSIDPTTFPNLAGQFPGYIFKQVQDFQLGNRSDDTMSAMAATVTNMQDLKDIAQYYSKQKTMQGKPAANKKLAEEGERLFLKGNPTSGLYGCVNCHGNDGKGKGAGNSLFPIIGGQTKAYIIKQLNDLKSGKRANDPAGMMQDIAKKLSEADIQSLAEFISSK